VRWLRHRPRGQLVAASDVTDYVTINDQQAARRGRGPDCIWLRADRRVQLRARVAVGEGIIAGALHYFHANFAIARAGVADRLR
jgi:hypothetical protein